MCEATTIPTSEPELKEGSVYRVFGGTHSTVGATMDFRLDGKVAILTGAKRS